MSQEGHENENNVLNSDSDAMPWPDPPPDSDVGKAAMQIHFERTGGFTGMRIAATIDVATLPEDEADELHTLVEAAQFFDLPETLTAPTPGADQFQYTVTAETPERTHTVAVSDAAAPETLQPLLRRLTILARRGGVA